MQQIVKFTKNYYQGIKIRILAKPTLAIFIFIFDKKQHYPLPYEKRHLIRKREYSDHLFHLFKVIQKIYKNS